VLDVSIVNVRQLGPSIKTSLPRVGETRGSGCADRLHDHVRADCCCSAGRGSRTCSAAGALFMVGLVVFSGRVRSCAGLRQHSIRGVLGCRGGAWQGCPVRRSSRPRPSLRDHHDDVRGKAPSATRRLVSGGRNGRQAARRAGVLFGGKSSRSTPAGEGSSSSTSPSARPSCFAADAPRRCARSRIAGLKGFDAAGAATITSKSRSAQVYANSSRRRPQVGWGIRNVRSESLIGAAVAPSRRSS